MSSSPKISMKTHGSRTSVATLIAALALGSCSQNSSSTLAAAPPPAGQAHLVRMQLLSEDQYRHVISDLFGSDIVISGQFGAPQRTQELLAVNYGTSSLSDVQIQAYDTIARSVVLQVVDPAHRKLLIPCAPKNEKVPDSSCAQRFFESVGPLLFRRPLSKVELKLQVDAAADAAKKVGDFYEGLGMSLSSMLISPEFLFRVETAKVGSKGGVVLDDYSKASRLSFFLWNTHPDADLYRAAEHGELSTAEGLGKQVDRMISSRRFESGVRSFFSDMLHFDKFQTLEKDAAIYPRFTAFAPADAEEQTLRTLIDLLVANNGDYRDIFTTPKTFLTPTLAAIYDVPLGRVTAPMGSPMGAPIWRKYEFPTGDSRSGVLSQASITALNAHPGRSSPTLRGKALREIFMCQRVPDPPAGVDFTAVNKPDPKLRTMRERLTAHVANPVCAGCHKITDPMGFALESFDGSGTFRTAENGIKIDSAGALNGKSFTNAAELALILRNEPMVTSCVTKTAVSYGLGRKVDRADEAWLALLEKSFSQSNYRIPQLFRAIVTSPEYFDLASPDSERSDTKRQAH